MKKLFIIIFSLSCLGGQAQIKTPATSPKSTISQGIGLSNVSIEYSRPAVKGRKIFGDLVPYGKVWRTGANQITKIKINDDMTVNGQKLAAGSYGLYTIPTGKEWIIIFNKDDKQWGAYNYKEELDVLRFQVPVEKLSSNVEYLTIDFTDFTPNATTVRIAWEKMAVRFRLEQEVNTKIMAEITEKMKATDISEDTYFGAADYYYTTNQDLKQAYIWADKVLEKSEEYWNYQLRARIAHKMGNCKLALPDAQKSMELAKKAGDDAYVKMNEKILIDCKNR
jgi:Protein of unknown function (DUF2911)